MNDRGVARREGLEPSATISRTVYQNLWTPEEEQTARVELATDGWEPPAGPSDACVLRASLRSGRGGCCPHAALLARQCSSLLAPP